MEIQLGRNRGRGVTSFAQGDPKPLGLSLQAIIVPTSQMPHAGPQGAGYHFTERWQACPGRQTDQTAAIGFRVKIFAWRTRRYFDAYSVPLCLVRWGNSKPRWTFGVLRLERHRWPSLALVFVFLFLFFLLQEAFTTKPGTDPETSCPGMSHPFFHPALPSVPALRRPLLSQTHPDHSLLNRDPRGRPRWS